MTTKYQVAIHHIDGVVEWVIDPNLSTKYRDLAGRFTLARARQLVQRINCELKWDSDTVDDVAFIANAAEVA